MLKYGKGSNYMKKLTTLLLSLTLCSTVLMGCSQSSQKETLTVGMELAYPPFETKDEAGNPTGISADFMKDFGEYIGKDIRIENVSWDGLIPSLQTGKVDMVMSSMTITDERKETVDFSIPYANAMLAVLSNKDSNVESVDDLNKEGMTLAVKTGSTGYLYAKEHLTKANIVALPDESACVTEVTQGKADGFIYDQLTIYRNHMNNQETTKAIFIPFQEADQWGIAVKKGNTELKKQLDEFITQYQKDGGFDKLSDKYLSKEKEDFKKLGFTWFFDL